MTRPNVKETYLVSTGNKTRLNLAHLDQPVMITEVHDIARILGGQKILQQEVRTLSDLRHMVAEGLPVGTLMQTTTYISGDLKTARRLRDQIIPPATRKRRKTRLKPAESERVERIARIMALAEKVWQDAASARTFLHEPHPLLDDQPPLEIAQTELGARQVEDLLLKLEYSLPV